MPSPSASPSQEERTYLEGKLKEVVRQLGGQAGIPQPTQSQQDLLARAKAENWTREKLQDELAKLRAAQGAASGQSR